MAEAKNTYCKSWKEIYNEQVDAIREWILKPDNMSVIRSSINIFIVVIIAILAARLWWYNLTFPDRCLNIGDLFKNGIESSLFINIFMMIGCVVAIIVLIIYGYFIKPAWWHLVVYIIIATYVCFIPQWQPIETAIQGMYYSELISVGLSFASVGEFLSLLLERITRLQPASLALGEYGFVAKTTKDNLIPTKWDDYIETIFELIGQKQLAEESFAIGIAGSWGSGKTTFYDSIVRRIKGDKQFVLCEFKPWRIINSSKLAPEFFAEFAKMLASGNEETGKEIRRLIARYAQLLALVPETSFLTQFITTIFESHAEDNVEDLRKQIDDILGDNKRNIVVMIDDLDRLHKDELLEIMRLVRASANFKHVLFILTYDKEYFAKEFGNKKGIEYLKKIVNVEISLPPIEQYKYGELLSQSIASFFNPASAEQQVIVERILSRINAIVFAENAQAEKSLLYKYLRNFRDVKRFANQFGLVLRNLVQSNAINKYDIGDLLWVELLHYGEENVYNALQTNYSRYLVLNSIDEYKPKTLIVKGGLPAEASFMPLLDYIFSHTDTHSEKSIIWINNYYSYFAHRQLDNYVSSTEFKLLLNSRNHDEVLSKVSAWWDNSYTLHSLVQILKDFPQSYKFESKEEADNYTNILLHLLRTKSKNTSRIDFSKSMFVQLFKTKYHQSYFANIRGYSPYEIIHDYINEYPDFRWNSVLQAMCLALDNELKNEESNSPLLLESYYILNKNELTELAQLNYTLCFDDKDMLVEDLFRKDSKYTDFINRLSYIEETDGYKPQKVEHYSNLIGQYITGRFDATIETKLGDETFNVILENLIDFSKVNHDEDEIDAYRKMMKTIDKIMGSKWNFGHLIKEHFNLGDENVKRCEHLGIKIV